MIPVIKHELRITPELEDTVTATADAMPLQAMDRLARSGRQIFGKPTSTPPASSKGTTSLFVLNELGLCLTREALSRCSSWLSPRLPLPDRTTQAQNANNIGQGAPHLQSARIIRAFTPTTGHGNVDPRSSRVSAPKKVGP
jgi:hypothetical protein